MRIPEGMMLFGPNRRSERTIIERQLVPETWECRLLEDGGTRVMARLRNALGGWFSPDDEAPAGAEPLNTLAWIFNRLALDLQRAAEHRVTECGSVVDSAGQGVWAWFEIEHDGVGQEAAELSVKLVEAALRELSGSVPGAESREQLASAFGPFRERSLPLVLPRETEAMVRVAARLGLPCFKLDREPYPATQGDFRIRPNGLLMVGHGRYRQIVDGTFCVSRSAHLAAAVRDREVARRLLVERGATVPRRAPGARNCAMSRHALKAAEALGFPVAVRPGNRLRPGRTVLDVNSTDSVRAAVDRVRAACPVVVVEAMVPGRSHQLLVAGGTLVGVIAGGREESLERVHPDIVALVCRLVRDLDTGLAAVDVVTSDISQPLAETGGAIVDLDPAPFLDRLVAPDSGLFELCAERFLQWLFPDALAARIPIFAVTGTNGKTTTCRMTARILECSGRHTGMVCSGGIYFGERFDQTRGEAGLGAHHRVLENEAVDAAVFEEYFGRIARLGFSFSKCDVAICTNVTNDHLGRIGTHTVAEMAQLKSAVTGRAEAVAVLNGDQEWWADMAARSPARRVCLTSVGQDLVPEMAKLGARGARGVVEPGDDGADWLVLHDAGRRVPVIAVNEVPATVGGTFRANISNALQAASACYFSGVPVHTIAEALSGFEMSFENTPGRLNRFGRLSFDVVLDYAHNADGFRQIASFADCQSPAGRKILLFSYSGDRRDEDVVAAATELGGHFDHYVCRNYLDVRAGRLPREVPALLRQGLMEAGVPDGMIDLVPDGWESVWHVLSIARPGDLLFLLVGEQQFDRVWKLLHALADSNGAADPRELSERLQITDLSPATK